MLTQKNSHKGGPVPKKSGRRRRQRSRTNKRKTTGGIPRQFALLPCSENYLRVISDPFLPLRGEACIPDMITTPSAKFTSTARGTFSVGLGGLGFVALNPWALASNSVTVTGTTVFAPIMRTNALYPDAFISGVTPAGPGIQVDGSNSLFSETDLVNPPLGGNQRQLRLVGAGLRISYTGTELNKGGRILCYRARGNAAIPGIYAVGTSTMSSLLRDNVYSGSSVSRNWSEISYMPDTPDLNGYAFYNAYAPTSLTTPRMCMIGLVDSAVVGNTFQYEAIGHFEIIGPTVGVTTSSESDPIGYPSILSSVPTHLSNIGTSVYNYMARQTINNIAMTANMMYGAVQLNRGVNRRLTNGPTVVEL